MDIKLLEKLCCASGVSGDEGEVRDIIMNEIKNHVDNFEVDALGNIIAFKSGKNKASKKIMLSAHMDEVGFVVTNIASSGVLKVSAVGGIDRRVILGKQATVGKNKINAVFGVKPIHLLTAEEKDKIPKIDDMYCDIGADNKKEAEKYIDLGDTVAFKSKFVIDEDRIISKALDDRIGCLVLIEIIKQEIEYDMYFTFVVQEEVGLRGAKTASYTVNPDSAIVVEATTACDVAQTNEDKKVCKLSEGSVISFMDRATIYDKEYVNLALEVAKNNNVAVQIKKAVAGGNDSGAIHCSRSGVRTLAVSFPCRYIHSANSIISRKDYNSVYTIVKKTAEIIAGTEN